MDKTVQVSVKGLLVTGLVLVALAVAYLLGQGNTPSATAAEPDAPDAERSTLTMRGTGEAAVVPDQAAFDVTVRLLRPELSAALDASNAVVEDVFGVLDGLGIPKGDVETTGLRMAAQYTYHSNAPRELRGYQVTQNFTVLVKELGNAGDAISAVVAEGGNQVRVGGIQLRVGDPEKALATARAKAVAAATDKATQYADAAGQALGKVVTLTEVDPEQFRSRVSLDNLAVYDRAALRNELSEVPIRTGRSDLSVTVQVVWELD